LGAFGGPTSVTRTVARFSLVALRRRLSPVLPLSLRPLLGLAIAPGGSLAGMTNRRATQAIQGRNLKNFSYYRIGAL
jgi:hypothetical protein